ncbi:hypothetical protein [Novosphingobium sp.]|uniref:hypothetical protein n=1 Tax=Novosphingobium sp. TaxID=1874826 RepID=UPI001D5D5AC5|nr:hypothetical protein [Novosphingobium sp.]MBX9664916.1 hypothetical protein [Novosphingobium sp.]
MDILIGQRLFGEEGGIAGEPSGDDVVGIDRESDEHHAAGRLRVLSGPELRTYHCMPSRS